MENKEEWIKAIMRHLSDAPVDVLKFIFYYLIA